MNSRTRAWAGIPDWAVHLFPSAGKNAYLWTGEMRITEIDFTDMLIRVRLSHANGGQLQTRLSRRETAALPTGLKTGGSVSVGIHETGTSIHFTK